MSWLDDNVLEISLHKQKEYYAIKEDAKNKPKSKLNNSENLEQSSITNPSARKKEKKKGLEKYFRNIANEELKKDIQTPKSQLKNSTWEIN